jgi:hypothetical protein
LPAKEGRQWERKRGRGSVRGQTGNEQALAGARQKLAGTTRNEVVLEMDRKAVRQEVDRQKSEKIDGDAAEKNTARGSSVDWTDGRSVG